MLKVYRLLQLFQYKRLGEDVHLREPCVPRQFHELNHVESILSFVVGLATVSLVTSHLSSKSLFLSAENNGLRIYRVYVVGRTFFQ